MYAIFWFSVLYTVLTLSHFLFQVVIAHLEHKRQKHENFIRFYDDHTHSVSVIVTAFNEDPNILKACIENIAKQDIDHLEIIIVDDGSKNRDVLQKEVYSLVFQRKIKILFAPENIGKRRAQKMAFDEARGDIFITIDSDTLLRDTHSLAQIVKRFKDLKVGAVTGDVRVENRHKNFLTKLISYRYWNAFHQERAAQSFFSVLMCCSGPFSAYRKSVIDRVKEKYISQTFLGKACTFGDDRHLTNLVLEEGYAVVFDNKAHAYTYVPTTLSQYIRQQIRWNKSFYREMFWTLKNAHKHHTYLLYDLLHQCILPFLLLIALLFVIYKTTFFHSGYTLFFYMLILFGVGFLRALYGFYRTKDSGFFIFVAYGIMHIFLMVPARLYALCTLRETSWGTRTMQDGKKIKNKHPEYIVLGFGIILFLLFVIDGCVIFMKNYSIQKEVEVNIIPTISRQEVVQDVLEGEETIKDVPEDAVVVEEKIPDVFVIMVQKNDSLTRAIRRGVAQWSDAKKEALLPWEKIMIETKLVQVRDIKKVHEGDEIRIKSRDIETIFAQLQYQSKEQIRTWMMYADRVW